MNLMEGTMRAVGDCGRRSGRSVFGEEERRGSENEEGFGTTECAQTTVVNIARAGWWWQAGDRRVCGYRVVAMCRQTDQSSTATRRARAAVMYIGAAFADMSDALLFIAATWLLRS